MFYILIRELRHRWAVYLLTIFVMSLVISVLVVQSSLNVSAEEKIKELSHNLGKSMLVVPEGTDLEDFYTMKYGDETMPDNYPDIARDSALSMHATMVEPRLFGNITLKGKDLILVGRNINQKNAVAVTGLVAKELGLKKGDTLDIKGEKLRVFAVIDPPPKGMDMALFVPIAAAQRILGKPGKINALYMGGCWCELDVPAFAAKVESTLPGTTAITVEGMAKAQQEIISIMKRYSVVLWTVGSVLAVGSIVFLILYMVQKSSRETGLLMSIGLSPGSIVAKNIASAVFAALSGSVLGFLLSVPLMSYVGMSLMRVRLSPSWELLPYFAGAALAISFAASILPSIYITRLEPTRLLREE